MFNDLQPCANHVAIFNKFESLSKFGDSLIPFTKPSSYLDTQYLLYLSNNQRIPLPRWFNRGRWLMILEAMVLQTS